MLVHQRVYLYMMTILDTFSVCPESKSQALKRRLVTKAASNIDFPHVVHL